jgi:hypothetical protein
LADLVSMPRNPNTNSSMPPRRSNNKATKITIRPYQKPPELPPNYYESAVSPLLQGCLDILTNTTAEGGRQQQQSNATTNANNSLSLQNSYQTVVVLVRHQFGPRLYRDWMQSMQVAVETALPSNTMTTATTSSVANTHNLVRHVPTQYRMFTDHYLAVCKHVFLPLDRSHVWNVATNTAEPVGTTTSTTIHQQTLWTAGLATFRVRLATLPHTTAVPLETALYQKWLQQLLEDWDSAILVTTTTTSTTTATSSSSDYLDRRPYLKAVWYMWQDLGLLSAQSPLPLQRDLEQYCARKGQEQWEQVLLLVASSGGGTAAARFIAACWQLHTHVTHWPWLPVPWLWHILDVQAVAPALSQLLQPAHIYPLLQQQVFFPDENDRPIQQLWMLAGRLPTGQQQVAAAICGFAKAEGLQRLQAAAGAAAPGAVNAKNNAVSALLSLQECLGTMIQFLPGGRNLISLKSVWEDVANAGTDLAESLAKFLDVILRSNKKMDARQSRPGGEDEWLSRIIWGLFVPLSAKDTFEAFYKRDLAKRLLWNRFVSMDVEKQVCSLLKAECGTGYTSKMEGMFQDIDFSRESMVIYKQSLVADNTRPASNVEMDVQILTTGYWPVYPQYPNLHLPPPLLQLQEHFDAHYKKKCHGRRITWQYALGHCVVRTNGFDKPYEFVLSLCQALVLVQFESSDAKWTLPALMQAIGMEDRDEMTRILQSLAMAKEGTRILRKLDYDREPGKKKKIRNDVHDKDEFAINLSFTSNQRRIRIQNIMMKETKEEHEKTVEGVSRDRLYLIDAVLVRIMKARKTILHQSLLSQVLEQVKFPAQASDVKLRIESLIEREYMERDAKDRSRYNYLA